eukprot:SAG31_NODE_11336_length_1041_cov_1.340764_2_plen_59_part_01
MAFVDSVVPQDVADVTYMAAIGNSFGYGGIQVVNAGQGDDDEFVGRVIFSIWDQGCDQD